jgi:hypothetical protein
LGKITVFVQTIPVVTENGLFKLMKKGRRTFSLAKCNYFKIIEDLSFSIASIIGGM